MRAKEYLKQYKNGNAALWRLQDDLYQAETNIAGSGKKKEEGMPKAKKISSQPENDAITITELQRKIEEKKVWIERIKREIILTIEMLESEDQKMVLSALYIKEIPEDKTSHTKPTKWKYVEEMVLLSERRGQQIHGQALIEIQKILDREER